MSQRVTVSVVAVVLLGAAAAFFLLPEDSGAPSPGAAGPLAAENPDPASAPVAELAALPAPDEDQGAPAPELGGRASAPEEPEGPLRADNWDGEERWIRGQIALPAGLPQDERMRVVAFDKWKSEWALFHWDGLLLGDDPEPGPDSSFISLVEATPDGAFALPVPAGQEEVHLALHAHYLYLSETVKVEDDDSTLLEPVFGGRIVGRLTPPAGMDAETAQLGGTQVVLGLDMMGQMFGSGGGIEQMMKIESGTTERRTEARADGTFELRALPPGEEFVLEARPELLAQALLPDLVIEPGKTIELAVPLTVGALFRGRVVSEEGDAIADAEVTVALTREAFGMVVPADQVRQTESGQDGTFELAGVSPGRVQLLAKAEGFLEHMAKSVEVTEGFVDEDVLIELSRGLTLHGVVLTPDGEPAAEAQIKVERDIGDLMAGDFSQMTDFRGKERDGEADAEGKFAIRALSESAYRVTASHEEMSKTVAGVRAGGDPLTIVLEPPVILEGLVVDESGNPIEEFTLRASLKASSPFMPSQERERESFETEDGRFAWNELTPGTWNLYATSEGFSPSEVQAVEVPRDPAEDLLQLVLPGTALVRGRVTTPDGAPAEGATVSLFLEMAEQIASQIGQRDYPEVDTSEDGTFEIELPPGERSLVATHVDWADSEAVAVSLESGSEESNLQLTLRTGAVLTGEVYEKDGEPAKVAQIIVQSPTGRGQRFAQSDDKGEFRLENVNPGQVQVIAMIAGGTEAKEVSEGLDIGAMMQNMKMAMVELVDGETEHVVLGAPPENPVQLRGRVTAAGEGVPEILVSFFPQDKDSEDGGMNSLKFTQTDDEGRFEFQLDTPGPYAINAQRLFGFGGQQQTVEFRRTIPEGDVHELELEMPEGVIRGTVYAPDGEPMPKARVSLTSSDGVAWGTMFGGQYADITTDERGEYELVFLRPGNYSVGAGGSLLGGMFGESSPHGRQVRTGIAVSAGQVVRGVDFRLEGSGEVHGLVRNELGKPVSGATVFLRDGDGNLLELFSTVQSDSSGRFRYPGVAPGEYDISARTGKHAPRAKTLVQVESGETSEVALEVTDGTMLLIELVDRSGAAVQARITVTDAQGKEYNGMMSMEMMMSMMQSGFSSTEQRVGPLAPGSYSVRATAEDGRTAKKSVTVDGQPERKLKVRLRD